MSNTLIRIYHVLPGWARSLVATGRGAYLSYWRYNHRTEQLVTEALIRDKWNSDQWKEWRKNRLAYILHRAATDVPYYQAF